MFTSPASSHSSSGTFGCPPVFGQGNQKGDAFAPNTLSRGTVFGSPTRTGMAGYGGTSTWAFTHTSAHLSSTTSGPISYSEFGSSTSALGHSSSANFVSQPMFMQWNQRGDSFAPKSSDRENVFGSPTGMSNSHGTSTWTFNQTSSSFSTPTPFGPPSSYILGSSTSIGPHVTKSTFNFKQPNCGGQGRGSRIANYKRTPETENSAEKLVSVSAMPVYKAKSHEELHWEDYKLNKEGAFGLAVKSTSSGLSPFSSLPVTEVSTNSWGTTTPMKPNPFGPTGTPTWKFPGPTSTSQPLPFSSSPNNSLTTVTPSPPLNSFNHSLFKSPTFTSPPSWSLAPLNQSPFTQMSSSSFSSPTFAPSGFWPTPIMTAVTAPANCISSGLGSTNTQPTTLFKPCAPSTQNNFKEEIAGTIGEEIKSTEKPSPFGTLAPNSHLSFEGSQSTQSFQYGISSIPVKDKPAPVRYSLLTTRHMSRRNNLPVRKYHPKLNVSKIPFFSDTKEIPVAAFIPRENPRALVVCPEKWPPKAITHEEKLSDSMDENGKDDPTEAPRVLDIPSKLQLPDYYTNPKISELESRERAEPGFCSHVNDFVIGRHGYGSIKFLGATDVRNLDLETYVQFNNREVIVYNDETTKPPVGQGLNKPAEITLFNIKCIDKRTGVEYKDGWKIDRYREMLKKKVAAQGGEFVSYDPVEGEWKFRVQHF